MSDIISKNQNANVVRRQEQKSYLPATDVWESADAIVMKFDMPGVNKDKVDVRVDKDKLTVVGSIEQVQQGTVLYQEYRLGDYRREFTISEDLDADNIKAQMQQGVLTLTIPKAEKAKPKRIEITGSE